MLFINRVRAATRRHTSDNRPGASAARRQRIAAICGCVLALAAHASAQDRVTPRPAPQAGRVLHVTTTQEMLITSAVASPTSEPGVGEVLVRNLLGFTQVNGDFDEQGRLTARLTIERLESREVLNGKAKSPRDLAPLVGQTLTATIDRQGDIVEITLSKDLQPWAGLIRPLVTAAFGVGKLLPAQAMSVGEQVILPADVPLRLPGSGETTPLRAERLVTLRRVEGNPGRTVHLEQRLQGARDGGVQVTGTGTIDVNLARGFVAASTTEWTVTGGALASQTSGSAMRATVKVTLTAAE